MSKTEETNDARRIYETGKTVRDFDYAQGLADLAALGDAEYVFRAGRLWPDFDFKKGLAALARLNSGKFIYHAGLEWKQFDYEAGQKALLETGDPKYIFYAGAYWKQFDFAGGFGRLLKTGDCEYLFRAGAMWKAFDYPTAWKVLESEVKEGEHWRGRAFENDKWRTALAEIWKQLNPDISRVDLALFLHLILDDSDPFLKKEMHAWLIKQARSNTMINGLAS